MDKAAFPALRTIEAHNYDRIHELELLKVYKVRPIYSEVICVMIGRHITPSFGVAQRKRISLTDNSSYKKFYWQLISISADVS